MVEWLMPDDGINQFTGKPRVWGKYISIDANETAEQKAAFEKLLDRFETTPYAGKKFSEIQQTQEYMNSLGYNYHKMTLHSAAASSFEQYPSLDKNNFKDIYPYIFLSTMNAPADYTINNKGKINELFSNDIDMLLHEQAHSVHKDFTRVSAKAVLLEKKLDQLDQIENIVLKGEKPSESMEFSDYQKAFLNDPAKFNKEVKDLLKQEKYLEKQLEKIKYTSEKYSVTAENIYRDDDKERAGNAYGMIIGRNAIKNIDTNNNMQLDKEEIPAFKELLMKNFKGEKKFLQDALEEVKKLELQYGGHKEDGSHVNPGVENGDTPTKPKGKVH